MPDPIQNRTTFFNRLHEIFLMKKGQGAFAYISVYEALLLFNQYLDSKESADSVINKFISTL